MIALVLLYAAAVGAVLGAAAWLVERAALYAGRPARWAWAAALVLAAALPAVAAVRAAAPGPPAASAGLVRAAASAAGRTDSSAGGLWTALRAGAEALAGRVPDGLAAPAGWAALDRPLAWAWALASVLVLWRFGRAARRARRLAVRWARREVAGGPVRVSADVGPAVVGALRAEVVVPAWALADPRLPVMLAHEREHLRARDPLLLAAGAVLAALTPWSPAAWWQLRRLRAAAELDCDRRVLAGRAVDPRAYGALLLDVAGRAPAALPALALAAPPTLLHRRIDAMTLPPSPRAARRALLPAALAAALVALACEVPRPTSPAVATAAPTAAAAPASAPAAAPRHLQGQDAPPLYVVDGRVLAAPAGRAEPDGLPAPDAIATVNVVKGDAATRQYGARARHGVVEIVTRAGAARGARPAGGLPPDSEASYTLDGRPSTRAEVQQVPGDRIVSVEVRKGDGRREVRVETRRDPAP